MVRKKRIIAFIIIVSAFLVGGFANKVYADNRENEIYGYCESIGKQYGISPEILQAIAYTESRYNVNAQNGECKGICQINFRIHANRIAKLGIKDPWNEQSQILLCADYLSELRDNGKYGEEISWVLDRYNGFSKADYYYENGLISDYSSKVLTRAAQLEQEHGK